MQSFAEQLNAVRKQRNITQEQLAERMNVSRTTISRWESGKIMPDLDTIRLLSQLLDYNFFSYEDTPAEEPAEAPAPESEELPAPKPKKHRIWLLIAIVVCIAVACAALIPRFLSKPEANVNAFSLSTVAYLETDEEIGDCWRVTFAFQNESDVPFTPDHVVVLFYENLLFTTNHLYYTRMECVMYGADANGHELQFRTSVKLSQEYATKPVKAEDQFGTLAEYIRAHESAKPEPGKAFLNVYTAVNPVKPVISEEFENRPMWIYDIQVAETNGVDFTVTDVQLIYFGDAWHIDRFDYTPERLDWPSDTIAAYKTASLTCGLPVQTMEGVGVSVFGKDANGNSMTFYGYVLFSEE